MSLIKLPPKAKAVRDHIVYVLAYIGVAIVRILPHFMIHFFAWVGALSIWICSPSTRRVILANLKIAFPTKSYLEHCRIGRASLYSLCMTTMESFWFFRHEKRIRKYISIDPEQHQILLDLHNDPKGAIYMVSHLGNWEMAGIAYPVIITGHIYAVARTFNNAAIDRLMTHIRTDNGNGVIKADEAAKGMLRALREGKMVPTLIDQNSSIVDGGVFVNFFGLPVPTSRAAAKFTFKLDVPMVMVSLIRQKGGKLRYLIEKVDTSSASEVELTQRIVTNYERNATLFPEQYLWFYKRFRYIPRDLPPEYQRRYPFYAQLTGDWFYPANHRKKEGEFCSVSELAQPRATRLRPWYKHVRDVFVAFMARIGIGIIRRLPYVGVRTLAHIGATYLWYTSSQARKIMLANLKIALPEKTEHERVRIAKSSAYSLCLTSLDCFWFSGNFKRIDRWVHLSPEVRKEMEAVVTEGKGVIYVTSHFGNWEMAALAYTHNYPGGFYSIARTFNNPRIDDIVMQMRTANGNKVIKTDQAAKGVLKALRDHQIVAVVNDQNTPVAEGGVFVNFFGLPAPTSRAPAKFALKMGCPVMLVSLVRNPDHTYKYFMERVHTENCTEIELAQKILTQSETIFLQYPEQYLWFYKRFLYIPKEISEHERDRFPFYAIPAPPPFYGVQTRKKETGLPETSPSPTTNT